MEDFIFFFILLFALLFLVFIIWGTIESNKAKKEKREKIKQLSDDLTGFENAKVVSGYKGAFNIFFNFYTENIAIVDEAGVNIIPFSDILKVDLMIDEYTLSQKSTTGTVGRALVGGAIAGGAGAVIGGLSGSTREKKMVSNITIKFLLRNPEKPSFKLICFDKDWSPTYKPVDTSKNTLDVVIYRECMDHAYSIMDYIDIALDRLKQANKEAIPNT